MAWAHGARFLSTAAKLVQLPPPELPEIAFVGRSNSGKSSAINVLANQRRLAFSSRTPGRTQHINLFELGPREAPDCLWADLPGYGFAAVDRESKLRWQRVMTDYLASRESLRGIVMLVDSRHGLTDLDRRLLDFVLPRIAEGSGLLVLVTKADKLSRKALAESLEQTRNILSNSVSEGYDVGISAFSSLNRQGVEDAALWIRNWISEIRVSDDSTVPIENHLIS